MVAIWDKAPQEEQPQKGLIFSRRKNIINNHSQLPHFTLPLAIHQGLTFIARFASRALHFERVHPGPTRRCPPGPWLHQPGV